MYPREFLQVCLDYTGLPKIMNMVDKMIGLLDHKRNISPGSTELINDLPCRSLHSITRPADRDAF